jgi:hypothetical protein
VLSVHWGVARRRGRRTAEAGVVVRVRQKLRPSRLRARRMRAAPAHVPIRRGGRLYRIRVDVQLEPGYAELQHIDFIRPADHGLIRRNGAAIGTLGGVVSTGGARFAVTAGHVAALIKGGNADCVDDEAGAFALGPVRANQFNAGTDIAAIGPVPQVPADAVLGNTIARNPTPVDTHHRVRLMLAGASTPIESHIDDVNRTRSFDTPAGVITMSGLTAIGRVTVAGDSGAPALDDGGALVGFVVGADALNTYLLPARRALDDLENAL